jgi:hypothetical protein
MENLTTAELTTTNGGSSSSGISLSSTHDSLLSLTFTRTYGSKQETTQISVGNNVDLGLWLSNSKK